MSEISLTETFKIAENDHGYSFGVGRLGDRWTGFAVGDCGNGEQMMFFLPGIAEDYQLGLTDREKVVKLVGAIAQAPEHGYGGIARWFVSEDLRGKPEDFRCAKCDEIGCPGECDDFDPFDEEAA